ncbi:MAG: hypothetical protein K9I85_00935 [Saprospiraceae bacterium]|nr:hypothetical protein [Saprospiraceae bacterium]
MKNYSLLFLFILGVLVVGTAQEEDPGHAFKKAKRALGAYNLDQNANMDKLDEAVDMMAVAITDPEMTAEADIWNIQGEIYLELANRDFTNRLKGQTGPAQYPHAPVKSFQSYKKALSLAVKNYQKKDALTGISSLIGLLNNQAVAEYQDEHNAEAFESFSMVIDAHNILTKEGEKSPLEEKQVKDAIFSAAVTGMLADKKEASLGFLNTLVESKYDNPYIFDLLYNAYVDSDKAKAVSYLETGRKLYPEDVSLLFTEINHYLREGKMDELTGKLKLAIEKEPGNKSLYLTLGNVYDNLFQKALEEKDNTTAEQYFQQALTHYQKALDLDSSYTDAIYSIGALYYNKAAVYTQELSKLADDYSKEGLKKYDTLKEKVNAEFDKALPYFKNAEQVDPNDLNTLIALKEIYARKNDLELSNEFKVRLERVQAGQENPTSYFK